MKGNDLPYKSKPAYITIAFGILGLLFFGFLVHLIYTSNNFDKGVGETASNVIIYIILGVFIFFGLGSFWLAIGMQIYLITESELIITRPLFFGERKILISDIERIEEKDFDIKTMNHSITGETIYTGRKAILILKSNKKIEISSIDAGGYKILITKLRKQWIKVVADALRHTAQL
ncbi:MAG: hypothetical protein NVSMB24_12400 [Mucilaginibacter sp.]